MQVFVQFLVVFVIWGVFSWFLSRVIQGILWLCRIRVKFRYIFIAVAVILVVLAHASVYYFYSSQPSTYRTFDELHKQ